LVLCSINKQHDDDDEKDDDDDDDDDDFDDDFDVVLPPNFVNVIYCYGLGYFPPNFTDVQL